ncbi:MAG: SH3 domain-containing protein [Caldilineaceae bacterium SB0666_bin_21]|nr:SH3 domain-containing protein [Caldilineaceae bacterium SB0666_bin_21]
MFRRSKPISAPPSKPSDTTGQTGASGRRKWVRWVVILTVVTAAGLARNQYPKLVESIARIPLVQDAVGELTGLPLADLLGSDQEPDGLSPGVDSDITGNPTVESPVTLGEENTVRVQATPTSSDGEQLSTASGDDALAAEVRSSQIAGSPTWTVGTVVQGVTSMSQIPLRMDPDVENPSMIAAMYGPATSFSIVEASLEYSYPVVIDGEGWWRVQAQDGLTGWVQEAHLE